MSLYWMDALEVWKNENFGKDRCVICSFHLEKDRFPDDYPKEWMFCCGCKTLIGLILDGRVKKEHLIDGIYDLILDKITIVKGNE